MELVIGRVAKSHGVRGEIVVDVRTDSPELRFADGVVLTGRRPREKSSNTYTVAASREHSGGCWCVWTGWQIGPPPTRCAAPSS